MPKRRTTDALLTADEVRDLIDRAGEVLEGVSLGDLYDGDDEESGDANRRLTIGLEAYRFALRNAEALGDPALLDAVLGALDINEDILWDEEGVLHEIFPLVLTALVSKVRGPEPLVDELVTHGTPAVRAAVAEGLRPRTRWARTHLVTLAHDFWPSVRVPAQRALRTKREVPTWWGRFDADPLEGLAPAEADALRPPLDALGPFFDDSDWALTSGVADGRLAAALRKLPAPLAAGAAEKVVRAGVRHYGKSSGLLPVALAGPDALGFVERWLDDCKDEEEADFVIIGEMTEALGPLPSARRDPLLTQLVARLAEPPNDLYRHAGFRQGAARLLGRGWPATLDPTPLLDLALAQAAPDEGNTFFSWIGDAIRRSQALSPATIERVIQAQQAGWPGRWSDLRSALEAKLEALPKAQLRPLAEKAAQHPDDRVATWALHQLLTALHDPARDPPRAEVAAALWREERARRLLSEHHPRLVAPLLRADLRAGRLTLAQAVTTLETLHLFYGGIGAPRPHLVFLPEHAASAHAHYRGEHADFLGEPALRGPITTEEWAAFREVRAAELEALMPVDPPRAALAVQFTPPGPDWDPADREIFWRGIKLCWKTKNADLVVALLTLMAQKPLREDMLILERLHRLDIQEGYGESRTVRASIRASLGLDADEEEDEPDEEPAAPPPSAND